MVALGNSLAVQKLWIWASTAERNGSSPCHGTKILHVAYHGQKKKKRINKWWLCSSKFLHCVAPKTSESSDTWEALYVEIENSRYSVNNCVRCFTHSAWVGHILLSLTCLWPKLVSWPQPYWLWNRVPLCIKEINIGLETSGKCLPQVIIDSLKFGGVFLALHIKVVWSWSCP